MISAKRLYVLRSINKENLLLPLISTKRLQGKILSVLGQEIMRRTITTCRCKFDSSNKKQMRDFSQRQMELLSRFSQGANQALEDQREKLVTGGNIRSIGRDEQVHDLRTELGLQALHPEDVTQQQNQEDAGPHQHLTGLVQETQQYR